MSSNLIIYYSRKGENYVNGSIERCRERGKSIIETILSNAIFDIIKLELTELFERGILPVRRAGRWV